MAARRHLPIVNHREQPARDGPEAPAMAWHWIPLATFIALAVGALLARTVYIPFMTRQLARVYGANADRNVIERIDRTLAPEIRSTLLLRLALGSLAVFTVSVFAAALVAGRFGRNTNARHGLLAGFAASALLAIVVARTSPSPSWLVVIMPYGASIGWFGARLGAWLRDRASSRTQTTAA